MFSLVQLAITIGLGIAQMLLAPRPRKLSSGLSPSSLSQFNVPTNEQGTVVPYVAGTALLDSPGILWRGDFNAGEIIDEGVVVGYRYDIGMQLALCLGEIDEVVEVRFDRKTLPGGPIAVSPDTDALAFHDGGLLRVAHIPQGFYDTPNALCLVTQAALDLAGGYASPHFRVQYGHQVVAGFSDAFRYEVRESGVWVAREVQLAAGSYGKRLETGPPPVYLYEIADALATAINTEEATQTHPVTVSARMEAHLSDQVLELGVDSSDPDVDGFRILGAGVADSVNLLLGFPVGTDVVATLEELSGTIAGTFPTLPTRYVFGGGDAAADFAWTRSECTCQALFGATGSRDYPGTGQMAEEDVGSLEAELTFTEMGDRTRIVIDAPDHFDADDGVTGTIDVWHGTQTQEVDDYLIGTQAIGPPLPAYRGLCYAVLRHIYIGNWGQFRPVSFVVRRFPNPLGLPDDVARLGNDANPALLLYDLLTAGAPFNQSPLSADEIEAADFEAAAWQLFREQLGVSFRFDLAQPLADLLDIVLKHIDAVRYMDPVTGRLRLKLIRADYDVEDLVHLDPSNVTSVTYGRRSWGETKNVVRATYSDQPGGFVQRVVQAQDDANIAAQDGNLLSESVEFEGFTTATRAQWAAERTLKTVSWPGAPLEIVADRSAQSLRPGGVFVLDWPPLGIANLVCRVATVGLGTLEDGRVTLEAVEDIWGAPLATYSTPSAAAWSNPTTLPAPLAAERLLEAPYELAGGEHRLVLALGARAEATQLGFRARADLAGGTDYETANPAAELTPSGTLAGLLGYTSDEFTVRDGEDMEQLAGVSAAELADGANLCLIEDEWVSWQSVRLEADGGLTFSGLVRGVLDSTPAMHVAGSRVWFVAAAAPSLTALELAADGTVAAKLQPLNRAGTRAAGDCTRQTLTTTSRAQRPYLPCAVLFDGEPYPDQVSAPVTLSWSHRDRLGEWDYSDAGATETQETGVTYEVSVWDDTETLVQHEVTALAQVTLTSLAQGWRVEIVAHNAADLASWTVFDYTVGTNHGWGLNWGNNFGGYQTA